MALPPAAVAAADDEDLADVPADDMAAAGDQGAEEETEEVLFTVCKLPDGTYCLIKGDEEEPAEGEEGAEPVAPEGEDPNRKTFDSPGALLKGILDLLNEDQEAAGGETGGEDSFQAGFAENAAPAAPMAQKY